MDIFKDITGQAEDPIPIPLNSLQDNPVRPPTVPNIASKRVSFDDETTFFFSHDDDDDAIRVGKTLPSRSVFDFFPAHRPHARMPDLEYSIQQLAGSQPRGGSRPHV